MTSSANLRGASRVALPLAACVVLGACTVMPAGPSVMALPGTNMSVDQYQADVVACQQYADAVIAGSAGGRAAAADNSAASTAAAGALFGAAAGAIIGSATGQAGQGAAIGAGTGLLFGSAAGSNYTAMSSYQLQRGYDDVYLRCMYSRGHRVPVRQGYSESSRGAGYPYASPAPSRYPPPNMPPPPEAAGRAAPYSPPPPVPANAYPVPSNVPQSAYPPPDTPPPANLPPRN
jgi:hypothetical protein